MAKQDQSGRLPSQTDRYITFANDPLSEDSLVIASTQQTHPRGPAGRLAGRSDPELIRACLAGKQNAWNELVERYTDLVYSAPRRFGLSESDAADVVQNVFIILFRKLDTLRDDMLLARWLLTTAQRETWRLGKSTGRYANLDDLMEDISSPSEDELEQRERQHIVRQALRQLGGPCAQLLSALFLEPGTPNYEAIADSLGMKVGSIGPTRARCFRKLEKILLELGLEIDSFSAAGT